LLFQTFLITLAMEGLEDKYSMELDKNGWNVLKNRKCFGNIKCHRIEQRMISAAAPNPPPSEMISNKVLIEEVDKVDTVASDSQKSGKSSDAKFAIASTQEGAKIIIARIPIPEEDVNNFSASVLADRSLCVQSHSGKEILNVSFPCSISPLKSRAVFNQHSKILTFFLPSN